MKKFNILLLIIFLIGMLMIYVSLDDETILNNEKNDIENHNIIENKNEAIKEFPIKKAKIDKSGSFP